MEYFKKLSLGTEVSFVLCPIDDYTGEYVQSKDILLYFPYPAKNPVYKPNGTIVFCKLPEGEYKIGLLSQKYLNEDILVQHLSSKGRYSIIYTSLKPGQAYPFQIGATLARLSVTDRSGRPLCGVTIRCGISSTEFSRAKVAKVAIKSGDAGFFVSSVTGKISVGDCYLIINGDEQIEECIIAEHLEGSRYLKTMAPFQKDHSRGSALMPIIKTRTDEKGEAVIYFRSSPAKKFDAKLSIIKDQVSITKEICVEESKTLFLGNFML